MMCGGLSFKSVRAAGVNDHTHTGLLSWQKPVFEWRYGG